ncbi:Cytochrome c heme lyase subunit CcmL [invertebrate metagenome]|uniref:Cytochrome c heme lyase subunit CcmL n=1 Tax=invertebrate metagenome TaxID=1711999 RepID=A0A484H4G3_9ZZZZ
MSQIFCSKGGRGVIAPGLLLGVSTMLLLCLSLAFPAPAVEPAEILTDPTLEARARAVSQQLRCMVCQNQSIDESSTELARDMRRLVREQILAGVSEDSIIRFLTDRYGDYVTFTPPFKPSTWLLWFGPVIFLLIAAWTTRIAILKVEKQDAPLSDEEQNRLRVLMQEDSRHG